VKLLEVELEHLEALSRGETLDLPSAPGWPHLDTLSGLGFVRTGGSQFLVIDDEGRIAGECGTKTPPDAAGTVEIGYGLAPASRGHGLGARAVAELMDWLGRQPSVRAVEAEVHESNAASRRVVERLGFTITATGKNGYLWYRRTFSEGR
jgi:RimJ/RimL family protein N-acetyltransferase